MEHVMRCNCKTAVGLPPVSTGRDFGGVYLHFLPLEEFLDIFLGAVVREITEIYGVRRVGRKAA